ncbi:phenylalanine--tRNA ligase subunit beta [Patescibacteria group bacterium]
MIFSYNWLQSFFKKKLPKPEKLAELLNMKAFEVEGVKKSGSDWTLDIDVLANRVSDCQNHRGMAREIAAITRQNLKSLEKKKLNKVKGNTRPISLKILCPRLIPRFSAIVIEGVKVAPSPQWLKRRLKTVGIRSINNIVDLTNFVMLETGQPLHAFDYDKIKEQRMVLRLSKKGENLTTLDGVKRKLEKGILVVEDKNRLIDLVGVVGGKLSEISSKTKNIVLQAGNFDRWTIYQATKKTNCLTEAANIYIHDIDPNLTIPTLERVFLLLQKMGGGKIVQIIDIYPKKRFSKKIKLDLNYLEKLLGIKIPEKEIIGILKSLEFKAKKSSKDCFLVEIPSWRLDISISEDLIEEIGRIYGYEKIKPVFPTACLVPPKRNEEILWENISKNTLKEAGFSEVYNYSFISQGQADIFNYKAKDLIEIKNPASIEQKYLRPSQIHNLLKGVKENFKYFNQLKIFELGKIFIEKQRMKNVEKLEKKMLSGLIAEKQKDSKSNGFYELKGIMDLLLNKLGISNIYYDDYQPTPEESKFSTWHPKKCAEIKVNNEEIGFLGEISPRILEDLEIEGNVVLFDLNFEKLAKLSSEEHEYRPISSFPAAVRDLALLVPRGTKVVEVLNIINRAGGSLILDIDLFDIYEGEEIPDGKKNLAFHIVFQSKIKTLSSKEIDKIQQKIIKNLEENPEWQVRK